MKVCVHRVAILFMLLVFWIMILLGLFGCAAEEPVVEKRIHPKRLELNELSLVEVEGVKCVVGRGEWKFISAISCDWRESR